jgi:hypothetical protein
VTPDLLERMQKLGANNCVFTVLNGQASIEPLNKPNFNPGRFLINLQFMFNILDEPRATGFMQHVVGNPIEFEQPDLFGKQF